jgi:hypothetical protein
MKKFLLSFLGTGLFIVYLSSCSKLAETPYSSIYTSNFYKTASDAQAALVSAFSPLADMHAGPATLIISDFSADQTYPRPVVGRNTYTLFNYDQNYTSQKSFSRYNESAQQVWHPVIPIENCPCDRECSHATMDTAKRERDSIGQAYFLRAFYLFTLTKNFVTL